MFALCYRANPFRFPPACSCLKSILILEQRSVFELLKQEVYYLKLHDTSENYKAVELSSLKCILRWLVLG